MRLPKARRSRGPTGSRAPGPAVSVGSSRSASGFPQAAATVRRTASSGAVGCSVRTSRSASASRIGARPIARRPSQGPSAAGSLWAASSMATRDVSSRRATKARHAAVGSSNWSVSSTVISKGSSAASSVSRVRVATPIRNWSVACWVCPRAPRSASACGFGSVPIRSTSGHSSPCRAAKASLDSIRLPWQPRTVKPAAWAAAHSSNAVFPMPGSPQSTRADPFPRRASSRSRSSSCRSRSRPYRFTSVLPASSPYTTRASPRERGGCRSQMRPIR